MSFRVPLGRYDEMRRQRREVERSVNDKQLRDHSRTLGVRPDASVHDINAAFRRLSKDAHPDAGGSLDRFTELQIARSALLDANETDSEPLVYLGTDGARPGESSSSPVSREPVWLKGAVAALIIGAGSAVVGIALVNQQILGLGVLAAVIVGIVVTAVQWIMRTRS
jgi:hypothetical protein